MIKKFFANLVNWSGQREDFAKANFRANQEDQEKLKRESNEHDEDEKDRKFVADITPPSEEGILVPSDSALKEEGK